MAEQPNNNTSDEIDLGQLFQMIGRGFNKLGIAFLRLFLYLKKRAFILGGLVVLGLGIGYGLNQITEEKKQIEVIIKPNFDSENYLYDVVDEIQNNIRSKDSTFFNSIGIPPNNISQYKIEVEPIKATKDKKDDLEYLELLEKFKNNPEFLGVIRSEILKNTVINHRLIFTFHNVEEGKLFAKKVIEYINSTQFFEGLITIINENANNRIRQNEILIQQIDLLMANYTKRIGVDVDKSAENNIFLENEKPLDIAGILQLKNRLIENSEQKRVELLEQQHPISVLNFGNPQRFVKSFFGKNLIVIPIVLLTLFFVVEFVMFLNKKSKTIA